MGHGEVLAGKPGTDRRPGSDQKHAVWWQHTPGQSRARVRAFHVQVKGGKGTRPQGASKGWPEAHVQCQKSNRFEPSEEKFGKSYPKM